MCKLSTLGLSIVVPIFRPNVEFLGKLFNSLDGLDSLVDLELILSISDSETAVPDDLPSGCRIVVDRSLGAGIGTNWNLGLRNATRDYLLMLGQDDIILDHCALFDGLQRLNQDRGAIALGSGRRVLVKEIVNQQRDSRQRYWSRRKNRCVAMRRDEMERNFLCYGNVFGEPSAVLLRRNTLVEVGRFSEKLEHVLDVECWLRIVQRGDFLYMPELVWLGRRLHPESATSRNLRSGVAAREEMELISAFARSSWKRSLLINGGLLAFYIHALRSKQIVTLRLPSRSMLVGLLGMPYLLARRTTLGPFGRSA